MMENLSLLVIHEQKESAERERDGEKAVSAAAESYIKSLSLVPLSVFSLERESKREKSLSLLKCV